MPPGPTAPCSLAGLLAARILRRHPLHQRGDDVVDRWAAGSVLVSPPLADEMAVTIYHSVPSLFRRIGSDNADGIARGALIVAGLTIFSRVLGLVRTLVFSQTVGAGCLGTAYVTANQVLARLLPFLQAR
jgi:hypothetical protein